MDPDQATETETPPTARFTDEYYGLEPSLYQEIKKAFDSRSMKKYPSKIKDRDLRSVMKSFGYNPSDKEMTDMLVMLDPGNTEKIEFRNFMKMMSKKMKEVDTEAEIKEAFGVLDRDNNGYITVPEFQYIMSHSIDGLPESELQEMISDLDQNGDGEIDYKDFAHIARYGKAFALEEYKTADT